MRPDIFLATIGRGSNGSNALEVTEDRAAVTAESQDNIINRVNNVSQYGPSWHYVPGIGVAGTAYAEVPGTALGDLAFSRASSKTRTNAAGVVETIAANVPPHDYRNADGSLSTFPRLNLEPQRTNLSLYSEQFDNATWTKTRTTVTANTTATLDPFGMNSADKLIPSVDNNTHFIQQAGITVTAQIYTATIFAKKAEYDTVRLLMANLWSVPNPSGIFNLTTGTVTLSGATGTIQDYGNGWYKCSITATANAAAGSNAQLQVWAGNNGVTSFAGDGTSGVYITGAQLEAGAYPTTYIPTTTAAVTRLADTAIKTGVSSLIGQTEGTLFLELIANRTGINQNVELGDGTTNNRIDLRLTLSNNFQFVIVQAGTVVYNQFSVTTFAQGQRIKIAAAYKSGDVTQIYVNGTSVASATAGTITGNFNAIYSASIGGVTDPIFSPISQAALFPTRLDNATLAQLTTL